MGAGERALVVCARMDLVRGLVGRAGLCGGRQNSLLRRGNGKWAQSELGVWESFGGGSAFVSRGAQNVNQNLVDIRLRMRSWLRLAKG